MVIFGSALARHDELASSSSSSPDYHNLIQQPLPFQNGEGSLKLLITFKHDVSRESSPLIEPFLFILRRTYLVVCCRLQRAPIFSVRVIQTQLTSLLTFQRYTDNGGSTLGIAGKDFTIIAGDTRSTSGYSINSRFSPKVFKIGGDDDTGKGATIILSVVGFAADGRALKERLDAIVKMYRYQHGKDMTVKACAQRLSTILYQKRFFPYYTHAILGGLDEEGKGALYSYDPVGSYEREQCRAGGAAASLIMPFLDNQVNFKNQYIPGSGEGHALESRKAEPLERKYVEELVKDAFTGAVERHIEVGDGLQMLTITKHGIEEHTQPLKRD